jgi:hypothetical protein
MANDPELKDLVVLVADGTTQVAVKALLGRPEALGIRSVTSLVLPHPERDPGCRLHGPEFLAPLARDFHHALLVFDYEGSGESAPASDLERRLTETLGKTWSDRAAALVLEPELEVWLWSDSPHVDDVLGWRDRVPGLRDWLTARSFLEKGRPKPERPKEAVEAALREVRKPRSSSLYKQIAERVSFARCTEPSFLRFRKLLAAWFPA